MEKEDLASRARHRADIIGMAIAPATPAIRMSKLRGKVENSGFVGGGSVSEMFYEIFENG